VRMYVRSGIIDDDDYRQMSSHECMQARPLHHITQAVINVSFIHPSETVCAIIIIIIIIAHIDLSLSLLPFVRFSVIRSYW
ncbi:hypothetical protein RDWZM_005758, partial [Blomia tropicalis]